MKKDDKDLDEVKIKRETSRIWVGVGLAVFGCILIMAGLIFPPAGVIHGSVLTAVGEIFGLSGASLGIFAYSKRDNAKIDSIYRYVRTQNQERDNYETDAEKDL